MDQRAQAVIGQYIVATPGTCGGSPRIDQTRVTVRAVVVRILQQGEAAEQFAETQGITLAQIYAALSYYYDHRAEIDREIAENSEEFWQGRLGAAWTPSASSSTKTSIR